VNVWHISHRLIVLQDIPDVDKAQEYIDQGKSLYCLEPAVLASSQQVSSAVDSCTEIGVVGGAMNEACLGSWQTTAEGVTSQVVRVDVSAQDLNEPFCYGGTSMYMVSSREAEIVAVALMTRF